MRLIEPKIIIIIIMGMCLGLVLFHSKIRYSLVSRAFIYAPCQVGAEKNGEGEVSVFKIEQPQRDPNEAIRIKVECKLAGQLLHVQVVMAQSSGHMNGINMEPAQNLSSTSLHTLKPWPGSVCGTKQRCCYPTTGKPATNFTIHGLWPYGIDGMQPTYCKPHNHFKRSKMTGLNSRMQVSWQSLACPSSNGVKLWSNEWDKYGTCSRSKQREYFEAALKLKDKIDLLQILKKSGIKPDGKFYSLFKIKDSLRGALGYEPGVYCNADKSGKNNQLYQIFICFDPSGSKVIECPGLPNAGIGCSSKIKFPSF
ncbi:hypothetical protein EZV62_017816 [Acer yangbiense]|uniref:Uncharacterized protein n=1 Tax=Acer yangbiense TaxID=1000413 RepID=A0A5C7HHG1_9ROSI|nr:hypothetical protein EZV62_017816 [Acer yangbiense]